MKKRIIISEDEKREIRGMYNLDESFGEKLLNKLKDKGIDIANKLVKKYTGKELKDITVNDLNSIGFNKQKELEDEVEIYHSFGIGDVVTIMKGDNQGHRMEIVAIEGNIISLNTGRDIMDYPAKDLRLEPPGTKTTVWIHDSSADGSGMDYLGGKNNNVYNTSGVVSQSEFLKNREWNGSEWVPKKS
jgi:hypothetical protein